MRQGETDMTDGNHRMELRQYLLGILKDEVSLGRIETRLMTDDKFANEIGLAESDLIEEYLDGELNAQDQTRFERHFLAAPERRAQLHLTQNLRKFSAAAAEKTLPHQAKRSRFEWLSQPSLQWPRFAVLAALLIVAGLGVWRFAIYESDTDKSLAQLRAAYRGQRPLEPRISALPDHVPFSETRGPQTEPTDRAALERAEIYLADATRDPAAAAAHHALALVHLTQGKFDRALREFDLAVAAAPTSAVMHSDAGAGYLAAAKREDPQRNGARVMELLDKSLRHLDRALAIDPALAVARFNRALALEILPGDTQAMAAWRDYLALDAISKWADEARLHIEKLEARGPKDRSAAELEREYLTAVRSRSDALAASMLRNNRELISGKYLPQRLANSYAASVSDRRDELRDVLRYTGALEMTLTGDPFATEMAHFYTSISGSESDRLSKAHRLFSDGCQTLLNQNYANAVDMFVSARADFEAAGDEWNAALSRYFIGYGSINLENSEAGLAELTAVAAWARGRGYLWLDATASHWVGGANKKLKRLSDARSAFAHALRLAERTDDPYALQRNLLELAKLSSFCGQNADALGYVSRSMDPAARAANSGRQRYRNLVVNFDILSSAGLDHAAAPLAAESVLLADMLSNPLWEAESRHNLGLAFMRSDNVVEARRIIGEARQRAQTIENESVRKRTMAFSDLRFGDLEKESGDLARAEIHFSNALRFFESTEMSRFREEAARGLLAALSDLGRMDELETRVTENIRLTEEFRSEIREEQEKTGYFDSRENIYDIAADFELRRGNPDRAYNYAEASSARSLLDWMEKGTSHADESLKRPPRQNADAPVPMDAAAIRARMAPGTQLLQYSVLNRKLMIWVVSRDRFVTHTVDVGSGRVSEKVAEFNRLVSTPTEFENLRTVGRELYDMLISPIRPDLDPQAEICVVPNKVLFDLAFPALVTPDGRPLIAELNLIFAPSANVYLRLSEKAAEKKRASTERLLAVGNPAFDRADFDDLEFLPDADDEVAAVVAQYGDAAAIKHSAATKSAFIAAAATADVIHFAGHYVVTPEAPASSYLLLAKASDDRRDSMLTNSEIGSAKMPRAKLIVLAACRSGIESHLGGEGMIGLSRTLLASSVPLVVGSRWSVDSRATGELMKRFHHFRRRENLTTSAALRRAQLGLQSDASGTFTHPYHWAAFSVFGGHAEF